MTLPFYRRRRVLLLLSAAAPSIAALGVTWVKFEDPLEHAFTLDVPQGWSVKGGTYRLGYSDHRIMVDLTSADGKINIRIGDVAVPPYFEPSAMHAEGEVYDLGAQARGTVAAYRTGPAYAPLYAAARFKTACATLTPRSSDLPPPGKIHFPENGGPPPQTSEGQVTYACTSSDGPRIAYAFTEIYRLQGFWLVPNLVSFVAPPEQVAMARDIVHRATTSLTFNPAWLQRQAQMDQEAIAYQQERQRDRRRAISMQVAQFESQMQAMQSQVNAFERGQTRQAAQVASVGNTLTGVTATVDPLGNPRNVFTGPKSGYWSNGRGETVNADQSPGAGWQPLTPTQ